VSGRSTEQEHKLAALPAGVEGSDEAQPSLMAAIVRNRWRLVLVTIAVTVLATIVLTSRETKTYAATSSVAIQPPPSTSATAAPNMATELQIARSLAVASLVDRQVGLHVAPQRLLGHLSVRVPVDSNVLRFTYSSPDPSIARTRADAFAHAYITFRQNEFQELAVASQERIRRLTSQLATLNARIQAQGGGDASLVAQRDSLTAQIALLQEKFADANNQSASFSPLGRPPLPRSPAHPNMTLNVILALFAGVLLGFALAAVREYVDDRVRSVGDLQARLGAPVLGVVPANRKSEEDLAAHGLPIFDSSDPAAEAFRRLRANVVLAADTSATKSLAVTNIGSDDPGTVVAAQLGVVLAATGRRVILVSTRRGEPGLEDIFAVPDGVGFLDAIAGTVSIEQIVHDSGFANLVVCSRGSAPSLRPEPHAVENGLSHVSPIPRALPIDLLASDRATEVISRLASTADFVVVDVPPLLADADAAGLVNACDGVLPVVRMPASRSGVERARDELDRISARVLGSVVVDRQRRSRKRPTQFRAQPKKQAREPEQPMIKTQQLGSVLRR
jgi:capsular polysaccharide biosynthesis protein/Mrp family chromosome partitioning ATPase